MKKGVVLLIFAALMCGLCMPFSPKEALAQYPSEDEERVSVETSVQERPQEASAAAASAHQTILKKLDEILKGIQELKDDLAQIKEQLDIVKIRVTQSQ